MGVPTWVIALAVAVPLTAGGTYVVQKVYLQPQDVEPVVNVDIDEDRLAEEIIEGQARKDAEFRASQKADADDRFCKSMKGFPGFDKTGACP